MMDGNKKTLVSKVPMDSTNCPNCLRNPAASLVTEAISTSPCSCREDRSVSRFFSQVHLPPDRFAVETTLFRAAALHLGALRVAQRQRLDRVHSTQANSQSTPRHPAIPIRPS